MDRNEHISTFYLFSFHVIQFDMQQIYIVFALSLKEEEWS